MRNGFKLCSAAARLSLTAVVAGSLNAAIAGGCSDQLLQETAANQVAGTTSRGAPPSTGLPKNRGLQNPRPVLSG